MNHQHKVDLVTAEHDRILGRNYEAADGYDQAIARARENGYVQEAALANELAARFYLQWGKEKVAAGYMQEAYYDYARWGAKAKTDDLENLYPQLLGPLFQARQHHFVLGQTNLQAVSTASSFDQTLQTSPSSSHFPAATLDFTTVFKASQALSSEIQLEQLVAKLLQVVMENAGAKKAALLIAQDDSLAIEAMATLTDADITVFSVPLSVSEVIPLSLVNYVKHSLKTVVLDDATAQTDFTADPYLMRYQPRSVLCTPILNQGKLIGLLYLENPLTVAAFTRDRLEVIHLLCTQAAISLENARLYRNLQASEARYQRLAENVPGVIYQFRLSPDGHRELSYISPLCVEIFEVEPESALADAQVILGMVHPDDTVEFEQSILASAQTLQPWQWVGRIRLPSGRVKWIQGGSRPERQSDGAIVWDGILMDVSDRKQAELEILRLNQALEQQNRNLETVVEQRTAELMQRTIQLEASNQELEFFSYSVSHDLRAPLRHINGFASALQQRLQSHNALSDPKVDHYVQVIQNGSQKMAQLIDGLLDLSRIGRKPMEYRLVNLQQLVDEAIASLQHNPDIGTAAEFVIGELPTVQGDARLLQQVLSNLIGNALKFSRHHPTPRIEIGSLPAGVIFIRDNGAGFDMKYADKLFGPFQRLHTPTEFEGTGIGLAIVQRIIHRHGGTIWAESQPNQGATFYFTLGGPAQD
ncbi:ATP-binding protein [Leptodesmis sichuanensis]|uniref:ATP-binding protein n=1 Tax=Leptodesmis sichuanensis TaxID=2906798 RepID=UPI001F245161|nr:ATP-binding protein [Leptodesmis sichuanensis]UIE40169.1 GAF domain-containing protein [Leptodesmis sichuanensis A121]